MVKPKRPPWSASIAFTRWRRALTNAATPEEKILVLQKVSDTTATLCRSAKRRHRLGNLTLHQSFHLAKLMDEFEVDRRAVAATTIGNRDQLPVVARTKIVTALLESVGRQQNTVSRTDVTVLGPTLRIGEIAVAYCVYLRLVLLVFLRLSMLIELASQSLSSQQDKNHNKLCRQVGKWDGQRRKLIEKWIVSQPFFVDSLSKAAAVAPTAGQTAGEFTASRSAATEKQLSLLVSAQLLAALAFFLRKVKENDAFHANLLLLSGMEEEEPTALVDLVESLVARLVEECDRFSLLRSLDLMLIVEQLPIAQEVKKGSILSFANRIGSFFLPREKKQEVKQFRSQYRSKELVADRESKLSESKGKEIVAGFAQLSTAELLRVYGVSDKYDFEGRIGVQRILRTTLLHPRHVSALSINQLSILFRLLQSSRTEDNEFVLRIASQAKRQLRQEQMRDQLKKHQISSLCALVGVLGDIVRDYRKGKVLTAFQEVARLVQGLVFRQFNEVSKDDAEILRHGLTDLSLSIDEGSAQHLLIDRRARGIASVRSP